MRGADAAAATSRAVRRPAITSATRGAHRPAIQATGSGRTAFWTTGSGRAALGTTGPAWTAPRIGRVPWLVVRWRAVSRACGCTATGARSVQAGGPRRNPTLLTIIGLAVLTQEEVGAYLPGAVFRPNGGNHCDWSVADGGSSPQATGHVTVTVETVSHDTGGTPTDDDARWIFGIRQRRYDQPGTARLSGVILTVST